MKDPENDPEKTAVNVTENVTENVTGNVTERASLLITEIKNNPFITTSDLTEKLSITRMTVHRDLEKLKNAGTIVRIGPDKGGHWEVKAE